MPVFALSDESYIFPDPSFAEQDGLLAVGGDLSPSRLVEAYRSGIFPWYFAESPILWWSPNPRLVLYPKDFHVPKSLKKIVNRAEFRITFDTDFRGVIQGCAQSRAAAQGTWIIEEMLEAYCQLHTLGIAHSVEAWKEDKLVGGLYGVSLGSAFFGESMFYIEPNASKVALYYLVQCVSRLNYSFIDCQQETDNLKRFGAKNIPRSEFLFILGRALQEKSIEGIWSSHF